MISETQVEYIPFALPDIGEEEIAEVAAALRSGWITSGRRAAQFEREFQEYTGAGHALAVNSCTAGLHLALKALGIGPGDEVITTPMTFCATVNTILETGAAAVLADIGDDLNLDTEAVARAITPRTKAILPVHLAGLACDMDAIWGLAREHGLRVVEDAAHAVGGWYGGGATGNKQALAGESACPTTITTTTKIGAGESDAVVFSFYATKNLTTGEGGMVTTGSAELAERMRVLCLHGISRDAWSRYAQNGSWYYEVTELGYKYNLSDVQAAIGIHQLRKLDRMNARRAEIAARYDEAFAGMEEVETPPRETRRAPLRGSAARAGSSPPHKTAGSSLPHKTAGSSLPHHAWHLYILRLNLGRLRVDRAEFFEEMRGLGVGCSVHFIPIPLHPYYRKNVEMRDPCARALAEYPRLISLPLYSKMTDGEVERVIAAVREVAARHGKP